MPRTFIRPKNDSRVSSREREPPSVRHRRRPASMDGKPQYYQSRKIAPLSSHRAASANDGLWRRCRTLIGRQGWRGPNRRSVGGVRRRRFQMNDVRTGERCFRKGLDVNVAILNNGYLGMVRPVAGSSSSTRSATPATPAPSARLQRSLSPRPLASTRWGVLAGGARCRRRCQAPANRWRGRAVIDFPGRAREDSVVSRGAGRRRPCTIDHLAAVTDCRNLIPTREKQIQKPRKTLRHGENHFLFRCFRVLPWLHFEPDMASRLCGLPGR